MEDCRLISDHHYKFECVACGLEASVSKTEDGHLEKLVCQTPDCTYEDTSYDRNAMLHVILEAPSMEHYHPGIRQILDEAKASSPMRPYLYRLVPGQAETNSD